MAHLSAQRSIWRPGWEAVGSANAIPPDTRPGFAGAGIPAAPPTDPHQARGRSSPAAMVLPLNSASGEQTSMALAARIDEHARTVRAVAELLIARGVIRPDEIKI